jgi:hypothetical protein
VPLRVDDRALKTPLAVAASSLQFRYMPEAVVATGGCTPHTAPAGAAGPFSSAYIGRALSPLALALPVYQCASTSASAVAECRTW